MEAGAEAGGAMAGRIVLGVMAAALLSACGSAQSPTLVPGMLPVEQVEVVVLESFPYQLRAQVKGHLADSCTRLDAVTQSREGNTITISITTLREQDAFCLQRIEVVERTIPIEGGFLPGDYVLRVNNVAQRFTL
jgi:inhibitor of cysteine peptidase